VSINTMTLSFFICPFNLRVSGWLMLVMTASDILVVSLPMRFDMSFCMFSISSVTDYFECDSLLFFASQVYNFFELFSMRHLRLGSRFVPQRLHFPSFIIWVSKLLLLYSCRFGGMYLSLSVFSISGMFLIEQKLSNSDWPSSFSSATFSLSLDISTVVTS
jgi:hypothetical protein